MPRIIGKIRRSFQEFNNKWFQRKEMLQKIELVQLYLRKFGRQTPNIKFWDNLEHRGCSRIQIVHVTSPSDRF